MAPTTRVIYSFTEKTFIENIALRPNGHLLLTTFRDGSVFGLDPNAENASPYLVARLPPEDAHLTGIVQISPDVWVITSGFQPETMRFQKGSIVACKLDLSDGVENAKVEELARFHDSQLQNGMTNIPENTHIILSVDSIDGRVFRINANNGDIDVVLQSDLLRPMNTGKVPLGINGAKVREGYLYFTNSNQENVSRVKIDLVGNVIGKVEKLVEKEAEDKTVMPYDDLDFDAAGNAYVAVHPNKLYKIDPSWKQTLFLGGGDSTILKSPTSCVVSPDNTKLYVSCAGALGEFIGEVVEVSLV